MNCNYITSLPFEKSRAKKGGNRALAGHKRVGHSDEHLITRLRAASLMLPCLWWMDTAATGIPPATSGGSDLKDQLLGLVYLDLARRGPGLESKTEMRYHVGECRQVSLILFMCYW